MEINDELKAYTHSTKCALLVWDVQNRLVENVFNTDEFLANTRKMITAARAHGVPVIFSKITPLPEKFESPLRKILFKNRMSLFTQTPNALDLAIEAEGNDIVIPKNTASMFIGTNFELLLRNAGLTTVVITGIATEMGVESTARDAFNRGFLPVIVTDAVSSMNEEGHKRSLANMERMMVLSKTDDIIAWWA